MKRDHIKKLIYYKRHRSIRVLVVFIVSLFLYFCLGVVGVSSFFYVVAVVAMGEEITIDSLTDRDSVFINMIADQLFPKKNQIGRRVSYKGFCMLYWGLVIFSYFYYVSK